MCCNSLGFHNKGQSIFSIYDRESKKPIYQMTKGQTAALNMQVNFSPKICSLGDNYKTCSGN